MSVNNLVRTQHNQAHRISAGVQDGSLTKGEAKELAGQQRATNQALASAKRDDGVVGPKERAEIRGQQAQSSKDIFQARHNDQTRPAPSPGSGSEHPRLDRQQRQADRIQDGVQDGSLTKGETARLVNRELRTDLFIAGAKLDDGKIGPVESARIERMQDGSSRAIFAQKHDGQTQQG